MALRKREIDDVRRSLETLVGDLSISLDNSGMGAFLWFDPQSRLCAVTAAGCRCLRCRAGMAASLRDLADRLDAGDPQPAVH